MISSVNNTTIPLVQRTNKPETVDKTVAAKSAQTNTPLEDRVTLSNTKSETVGYSTLSTKVVKQKDSLNFEFLGDLVGGIMDDARKEKVDTST